MEKIYGFVPIAIHDGDTAAFEAAARACHDAILPDITGTQYYEWYLSADGRQAYVIEVYDDPAALALHGKMQNGRVAEVMAHADLSISFAGQVPDAVQDRMRQKLGRADYLGPLAFGRMTDPAPHRVPPPGDERLCALAWFQPHGGQAERFRDLARQAYDQASTLDPGTFGYEWFFDADGSCVALDVYRDADAMLAHMRNCGPIMAQMLEIADARTILFGALPPEIEARLRPELGITRYPRRLHGVG